MVWTPRRRQELEIRYMGARLARKDWRYPVAATRDCLSSLALGSRATAHPTFDATRRDFVLILRDRGDNFHARSVTEETFAHLPETVSTLLLSKGGGRMPMDPVDEVVTQLRDAIQRPSVRSSRHWQDLLDAGSSQADERRRGRLFGSWIPRARPNLSSKLPKSV